MTQSYAQLQKQIEVLQRQAEKLRAQEVGGVIDRIKVAFAEYGLTAQQLGFGSASGRAIVKKTAGKAPRAAKAKYANAHGQVWGGMGPRPAWLRAEMEAGKSLEDFLVGKSPVTAKPGPRKAKSAAAKPASVKVSKGAQKRRARTQYRDPATDKTWAGMGPQPRWLKDLIASGKTLEELAI